MSKINTEVIIASLFRLGFNQVDSLLYTYTLGKILKDNDKLNIFEFEDKEISETFNKYIDYDGIKYKIKDGYDLNSIVSLEPIQHIELPLYKLLNVNTILIEYLTQIDFREIVLKKINSLGFDRINEYSNLFSLKEKKLVSEMFGIEIEYRDLLNKKMQYYANALKQEESSNEMLIAYLDSIIESKNKTKIK